MNSCIIVIAYAIVGQVQVHANGPSVLKRTSSPCFQSPCENNGRCYNTPEGYYCQCPEGYSGRRCEVFLDDDLKYNCTDSDPVQCPLWAKKGECQNNSRWMLKNCKKSCKVEKCGCTDSSRDCAAWAKRGECHNNPWYMLRFCGKHCGGCTPMRKPSKLL